MAIRGGSIINISGKTPVDDPEYRYRMPAVFGKIEGSGNGIKTVIPNIYEVGLSLHRNPAEVNKFFGCELGAQTTYSPETNRAVVNGAHTDVALQALIHRYVEAYVLCPNCRLPETEYKIKSDVIFHKCAACGAKERLDMTHKLTTFILAQDKKAKKEGKKGDKKKDKKKDKNKDEDDDHGEKDKEKKKKDKKKKKDGKDNTEEGEDYIKNAIFSKKEDDFFCEDADEQESLDSEAGVDDEGALKLAVEATKKWIRENKGAGASELAEVITNQQMASALKSHDKVHIAVQAMFTPQFFKNEEVMKFAPAIALVTNENPIMERHLIAALEAFCIDKPKNFPVLLKQLYDHDAVQEETILQWADEGRNEYTLEVVDEETRARIRAEAEPVVVWLQEAESDEEDDED